ncbi:MAG: hypothetical protein WCX75_00785 [Fibrobacteraceae bacterium]
MTPLDALLTEAGISNHALAECFPGFLTHKTIQKARTGKRPLSRRSQVMVTEALNRVMMPEHPYKRDFLFPRMERTQASESSVPESDSE